MTENTPILTLLERNSGSLTKVKAISFSSLEDIKEYIAESEKLDYQILIDFEEYKSIRDLYEELFTRVMDSNNIRREIPEDIYKDKLYFVKYFIEGGFSVISFKGDLALNNFFQEQEEEKNDTDYQILVDIGGYFLYKEKAEILFQKLLND